MTMATQPTSNAMLDRPSSSGLADVLDIILDKGMVIDAYVRVSLVGIELLTIDARIVIASVDTYLRFAEAVNRLDISGDKEDLPGLIGDMAERGSKKKTKGALDAAGDKLKSVTSRDDDRRESGQDGQRRPARRRREDD
jgi:gas vesicle structural protein